MKSRTIFTLFIIAFAAAVGVWYYAFQYSKTHHREVEDEDAITVTANQIVKDFETNEANANKIYLNKVVQVSGEVLKCSKDQAGNNTVTLKSSDPFSSVFCTLKKGSEPLKENQTIVLKGICAGFLTDVVLNEAIVTK